MMFSDMVAWEYIICIFVTKCSVKHKGSKAIDQLHNKPLTCINQSALESLEMMNQALTLIGQALEINNTGTKDNQSSSRENNSSNKDNHLSSKIITHALKILVKL